MKSKKKIYGVPITARLSEDMIADLDAYAEHTTKATRNPTSRADAIRLMVARGLQTIKETNSGK